MPLTVGSRLGHYDVTALIGEGGMGQVYQATDTKLNRQVALKILPEAFATDPDRLARFQREAQVLASLNHPNIAAIYGLEEADDTRALVLELVEGPTLADRIAQGPIPVDEALPIAKQIAEALEAAHEAGVIHRDLKPANIKVREDGTVKVLDFGLAKALDTTPQGDPSQSPTLTAAATQMGVIMGTAAYMSPEQARGKPVDRRADIWSFGVVLYEILTGVRPFRGEDVSLTLASVMKSDVDVKTLSPDLPETLRTVLRRCLEKDPLQRIRDMGDVRLAMEGAFETTARLPLANAPIPRPEGWRQALPWVAGILLAAITGFTVWGLMGPTPALPTRFPVVPPAGVQPSSLMISPDGRTVAFTGTRERQIQVYIRPLDQLEAVPLQGTEGTSLGGFSPGGEWLVVADLGVWPRILRRVPLAGGPGALIGGGVGGAGRDATWGPDDTIVFGSDEGLWSLPAAGGERTPFTTITEGEIGHYSPKFLPNGRDLLFFVYAGAGNESHVAVYDGDTGQRRTLLAGTSPQFGSSGHLVFWNEGSLWAVPFDAKRLEVRGVPRPIEQDVAADRRGVAEYALGKDGTLLYRPAGSEAEGPRRTFVWVDREGVEKPVGAEPRPYSSVRLSPDDGKVLTVVPDPNTTNLVVYDLVRGAPTQLTFDPADDSYPIWAADGTRVFFASRRAGPFNMYTKAADGTGQVDRLISSSTPQAPHALSPDGQTLVLVDIRSSIDLGLLSLEGDPTIDWLLEEEHYENFPAISPDGRWIAYVSDQTGQFEVWVRPFSNVHGGKWRISSGGGYSPLWGPDSRELFYHTHDDAGGPVTVMVAANETVPTFVPGSPRPLFEGPYRAGNRNDPWPWDITSDGERFLMIKEDVSEPNVPSAAPRIIVVEHWLEELKRLVPIN